MFDNVKSLNPLRIVTTISNLNNSNLNSLRNNHQNIRYSNFQMLPPKVFCKKGFAKFTRKHMCKSLLFNKKGTVTLSKKILKLFLNLVRLSCYQCSFQQLYDDNKKKLISYNLKGDHILNVLLTHLWPVSVSIRLENIRKVPV